MDMAQNRSLWRMWSMYDTTQSSVACQKRRRRWRLMTCHKTHTGMDSVTAGWTYCIITKIVTALLLGDQYKHQTPLLGYLLKSARLTVRATPWLSIYIGSPCGTREPQVGKYPSPKLARVWPTLSLVSRFTFSFSSFFWHGSVYTVL